MAEIELNVLTGQCLNKRIDKIETVKDEVAHGRSSEIIKMQR
jgi:hypothetical protein